ncbi:MAG: hypothetical protein JKX82_00080 [Oleispira sp.]|nr:hypothetical protein [Oleispira sp.]
MRINKITAALIAAPLLLLSSTTQAQSITEQTKLISDSSSLSDSFGNTIDIDNNNIVVGAPRPLSRGAAFVFDSITGEQLFELTTTNPLSSRAVFGSSIAIQGDLIAVGAPGQVEMGLKAGAVFLFDRITGSQIAKLLPQDGQEDAYFGYSVDIDDGVVAVGAYRANNEDAVVSGAIYLFDASTGTQIAKLAPDGIAPGDGFGTSVTIDNGLVAATSTFDNLGSVYVFDIKSGTQIAKLLPDENDGISVLFGASISLNNNTVVIGATYEFDKDTNVRSGSAYVFDVQSGEQLAKLYPTPGDTLAFFGNSVALNNNSIIVGAQLDYGTTISGAAYLFDASTYSLIAKLLPTEPLAGQQFGQSVSIQNDTIAIGSSKGGGQALFYGSAYVLDISDICTADIAANGILNFFDASAFLQAFTSNDPIADFTNDDSFNFFDISAFLQAFSAGCP